MLSLPPSRAIPESLNHSAEAPGYWKILEHIRKQVAVVLGEGLPCISNPVTDNFTTYSNNLTIDKRGLDHASHPALIGTHFWHSKSRIGAAGELFVSPPHHVHL